MSALKPYLDALPLPNNQDLGQGFADFVASWSDQSRVDATSVRIDHNAGDRLRLFGRVSHAPSYSRVRPSTALSTLQTSNQNSVSVTSGATWVPSFRLVHDLRVNYTTNRAPFTSQVDTFGGSVPPPASIFEGAGAPDDSHFTFVAGSATWHWGTGTDYVQRQLNVVDSVTLTSAAHQWKFGVDFRRLNPRFSQDGPKATRFLSFNAAGLQQGRATSYVVTALGTDERAGAFDNLSLFAQDTWKLASRLTLTYGVRWDLVRPPYATHGDDPITLENLDEPYGGQVHIAPRGTALWDTRYNNFAPRVGASYVVSQQAGRQLVVRGGAGKFFDLGYGVAASAFATYPFSAAKSVPSTSLAFPLSADVVAAPRLGVDRPSSIIVTDRHLTLPYTYQWNISAEQSLGQRQTLTLSFVGAEGRDWLKYERYLVNLLEWPDPVPGRTTVTVSRNRAYSDYRALQVQYQRRLHRGLQGLLSYTLGRSRDTASNDSVAGSSTEQIAPVFDYGHSDYDVRHNVTAAITYTLPEVTGSRVTAVMLNGWSIDGMLRARTGFPLNPSVSIPFPPENVTVRPNVVQDQPFWIADASVPNGRRLNRQAFSTPASNSQGDLVRGTVRGFSARQVDMAIRRAIPLSPRVSMQVRFEMFNVFNIPNFDGPVLNLSSAGFGVSSGPLNRGLSSAAGGLNALYQMGGPRSSQVALKLIF